jgi:hypothetical protein
VPVSQERNCAAHGLACPHANPLESAPRTTESAPSTLVRAQTAQSLRTRARLSAAWLVDDAQQSNTWSSFSGCKFMVVGKHAHNRGTADQSNLQLALHSILLASCAQNTSSVPHTQRQVTHSLPRTLTRPASSAAGGGTTAHQPKKSRLHPHAVPVQHCGQVTRVQLHHHNQRRLQPSLVSCKHKCAS